MTLPLYFVWIGIALAIGDTFLAMYLKPRGWHIWGIDWQFTRIVTRGLFILGCLFTMVATPKTDSEQDIRRKIRNTNFRLAFIWLCLYVSCMPLMDWKFGSPADYNPYALVITTTIMFHIFFFVQWMAYKLLNPGDKLVNNEDKLINNEEPVESRKGQA